MKTADFDFALPDGLVARFPPERRDGARMLVSRAGAGPEHRRFTDLPALLSGEEVVVVNDTRVLRARVFGTRAGSPGGAGGGGGRVEVLFLRPQDDGRWLVMTRAGRPLLPGAIIDLPGGARAELRERREDGTASLALEGTLPDVPAWLRAHGEVPLPPYLRRGAEPSDAERYQTVFAAKDGAVAAPTAGIHFTHEVLGALEARGCLVRRLTLHVGPGTFRPVITDDPRAHDLDPEPYDLPDDTVAAVASGRPVLAVGTTVVRALEHAARAGEGTLRPGPGLADLLMLPGDRFRVVSRLLTNFHLPRSSLLMLVCAFAGPERVLSAYAEAVREGYRFYSYGDATLWL